MKSQSEVNQIKSRRLYWLIITLIVFCIFYWFLPLNIYNNFPVLTSIIGSFLVTVLLIQTIGDYRSWQEFNNPEKKDWRFKITPLLLLLGIVLIFIFWFNFSTKEKSELKSYGVVVSGKIIDGNIITVRKGLKKKQVFEVKVKFTTETNQEMIVKENLHEKEYIGLKKGQDIKLIYSRRNPKIIDLITNAEAAKDFLHSENRKVTLNDLIYFIEKPNLTESDLEKICFGWTNYSSQTWINTQRNISIMKNDSIIYTYIPNNENNKNTILINIELNRFLEEMKELGFIRLSNELNENTTYESKLYYILITTMNIKNPKLIIELRRK